MSQKNKRNTRRGRAERWKFNGDFWEQWTRVGLLYLYRVGHGWLLTLRSDSRVVRGSCRNRAAAMRAAEHMARAAEARAK